MARTTRTGSTFGGSRAHSTCSSATASRQPADRSTTITSIRTTKTRSSSWAATSRDPSPAERSSSSRWQHVESVTMSTNPTSAGWLDRERRNRRSAASSRRSRRSATKPSAVSAGRAPICWAFRSKPAPKPRTIRSTTRSTLFGIDGQGQEVPIDLPIADATGRGKARRSLRECRQDLVLKPASRRQASITNFRT